MKKMIILTAAFLWASAGATANELIEKATQFVDALEAGNITVVEALVGEEMSFEDPTFSPRKTVGRDAVINLYRGYTSGVPKLHRYTVESFENNGTVVMTAIYYAELDMDSDIAGTKRLPVMGKGMKVITFKDGKIIRHIDLADYAKVNEALAEAQKAQGD